jgi:uncharacterized protein
MKRYLLDVNVLVALLWPAHQQHDAAAKWFARNRKNGWVTCPFTEAGFVRITSNPSFSRDSLRPIEAFKLLRENTEADDHFFWAADFRSDEVYSRFAIRMLSHQDVTDAYLLTLADLKGGILATFDKGIENLCKENEVSRKMLEIIGS